MLISYNLKTNIMNKVILGGRLGKDSELSTFENGGSVLNFSIATNDGYKDKNGEYKKVTDWHDCQLSGSRAETLATYLKKGTFIMVEAKHKTRQYEKDGKTVFRSYFHVLNLEFCGSSNNSEKSDGTKSNGEDDLPF